MHPPLKMAIFLGGCNFSDLRIQFLRLWQKIWHAYFLGQSGFFDNFFLYGKPKMTKKIEFQNQKSGQKLSKISHFLLKIKLFCHFWINYLKTFFDNRFWYTLLRKKFFFKKKQKWQKNFAFQNMQIWLENKEIHRFFVMIMNFLSFLVK